MSLGGKTAPAAWLALCAAVGLACGGSARELSMIWISLDTLRADHLGAYGYTRETSPFLDELARRGLRFAWAVSPQNSTLPTHVSMFTGHHPLVHGVMHSRVRPGVHLAPSVRTLPEILRDAGFTNRAWVDGAKMKGHFGFARGFETYDDARGPFPDKLAAALAALEAGDASRRFFYLIHTYEVHGPYAPPAPYDARFRSAGPESDARGRREADLYDGSIRFVDDELRAFAAALERMGVMDTTILVVTSDHGESFAEYGIDVIGHAGRNLHQNVTRVPWIVLHPDPAVRGEVTRPVGLVDFANTTLGQLGVEERAPGGGRDVLGPEGPAPDYVSWAGGAWSLYADGYHLLSSPGDPGPERNGLFHVAEDPLETRRVDDPERTDALRARLAARREELERRRDALQPSLRAFRRLPADTAAELRALGYVVDP